MDKDHGRWSRFRTRCVKQFAKIISDVPSEFTFIDIMHFLNCTAVQCCLLQVEVLNLFYELCYSRFLLSPQDSSLVRCPNPPLSATATLLGHVVNELSEGQSEYELALELVDLVHLLM